MNVECPWRSTRCLTTDFVTPNDVGVKEQTDAIRKFVSNDDDFIRVVCAFVRDEFKYPLDNGGNPSAGLLFKRYDKGCCGRYFFSKTMDYAWGYPNETLALKLGICIDTACLTTSLLKSGGIDAKVVLGSVVNNEDNSVAGYHAWTKFLFKGIPSIDETTIHSDAETIIAQGSVYNRTSDWSKNTGIHYENHASFDDLDYYVEGLLGVEMACLMGMSPSMVECYGAQEAISMMADRRKKIAKEWRKADIIKHRILSEAWGA